MAAQDLLWLMVGALGLKLLVQGVRLRSAEAPLGTAMVLMGAGAALVRRALETSEVPLAVLGLVLLTTGTMCLAWFTQLVFHPGRAWARAAVGLCLLLLGVGLYHQLYESGLGSGNARQSPVMAVTRALVLGWAAVESLRFRRQYARRASLGLADPVVVNRFLLFSVWTTALALMPVIALMLMVGASNTDVAMRARVMAPARILGVVCLVSIYLTFLPPAAYLRWVVRRASSTTADA